MRSSSLRLRNFSEYIHDKLFPNPESFLVSALICLAENQDSSNLFFEAEKNFREAIELNNKLQEKYNPPYLKKQFSYFKMKLGEFQEAQELAEDAILFAKTDWHSRAQVWAWFPLMGCISVVWDRKRRKPNITRHQHRPPRTHLRP